MSRGVRGTFVIPACSTTDAIGAAVRDGVRSDVNAGGLAGGVHDKAVSGSFSPGLEATRPSELA